MASRKEIVEALLERHGRTFSEELGIHPERNTPAPLFQLLVFALLSSTRIGHETAVKAAHDLWDRGWSTPQKRWRTPPGGTGRRC